MQSPTISEKVNDLNDMYAQMAIGRCLEKLEFMKTILDFNMTQAPTAAANNGLKRILEALNDDLKFASEKLSN